MGGAVTALVTRLHAAIVAAGVPIASTSIGDEGDRATWTVQPFTLQTAAQPIIDAFVMPTAAQLLDEDAARDVDGQKAINATVRWTLRRLLGRAPTGAELQTARSEWIAIYKSLP
jgi:hypothetical protein